MVNWGAYVKYLKDLEGWQQFDFYIYYSKCFYPDIKEKITCPNLKILGRLKLLKIILIPRLQDLNKPFDVLIPNISLRNGWWYLKLNKEIKECYLKAQNKVLNKALDKKDLYVIDNSYIEGKPYLKSWCRNAIKEYESKLKVKKNNK